MVDGSGPIWILRSFKDQKRSKSQLINSVNFCAFWLSPLKLCQSLKIFCNSLSHVVEHSLFLFYLLFCPLFLPRYRPALSPYFLLLTALSPSPFSRFWTRPFVFLNFIFSRSLIRYYSHLFKGFVYFVLSSVLGTQNGHLEGWPKKGS